MNTCEQATAACLGIPKGREGDRDRETEIHKVIDRETEKLEAQRGDRA